MRYVRVDMTEKIKTAEDLDIMLAKRRAELKVEKQLAADRAVKAERLQKRREAYLQAMRRNNKLRRDKVKLQAMEA